MHLLTHGGEPLLLELEALTILPHTHLELCYAARSFAQHEMLSLLIESNSSTDTHSPWSAVRHYIGRLGCWFTKCYRLVSTACRYPQLLENATCQFLALPEPSRLPPSDAKTNLESALRRMLPLDQQHRATEIYNRLTELRDLDIEDAFIGIYSNDMTKTIVHAELFLMEHFYFNDLRFVGRERYIGCSKRSCYCCSLYIRYHPGNFVMRPAHNNAYVTWCPPLFSRLDEERERKHNSSIMNQMNAHIRRDVMQEIESQAFRREKGPDSTTGFEADSLQHQN